ncbi:helix-turn-helix domain-containing protein [Paenibacillus mendelii]|uniref:Helix-turn-helix domain-containing protein n=1 Tax=Paenibacillus mendelii TaxID=206163 RepID=A0ABV6JBK6_9BACL|nr:helix-turn-helix domain-containing protein [Paenibacillus mendelii]MCQ6558493.1 helix-turn-helix domain-containing protein [Paenibacillus mendelii]
MHHINGRPSSHYGTLDIDTYVAGHFNEADSYSTLRPEGRADWLITYTLSGEGYFKPGNTIYRTQAGDVALLKPGTPQHYGTNPGHRWNFIWTHFTPSPQDAHLWQFPDQEPGFYHVTIENSHSRERIAGALSRIIMDVRQRRPFWKMLCAGAIQELLLLLSQTASRRIDPRVEEAHDLLTKRMKEQVRIEEIAKAVGISESRLSHLFKSETGQSVIDALNRMRLREAAALLLHTHRSAVEISEDVGFSNYNHFLNQFKRRYGESPRTYRKRNLPSGSPDLHGQ